MIRIFLTMLIVCSLVPVGGDGLLEASALDLEGSININIKYGEKYISNAGFKIYRIATYDSINKTYRGEGGINIKYWSEKMTTSDEISRAVKYFYNQRTKLKLIDGGLTNSAGNLYFSNLEDGLYLVVNSVVPKDYTYLEPVLVKIPMNIGGRQERVINYFPKPVPATKDRYVPEDSGGKSRDIPRSSGSSSKTSSKSSSSLPKTGNSDRLIPIKILFVSVGLILLFIEARNKRLDIVYGGGRKHHKNRFLGFLKRGKGE